MAPITPTEDYLVCLKSLVEPAEVLEKHAFAIRQLTEEDLLGKRRCSGCGKRENLSSRKALEANTVKLWLG